MNRLISHGLRLTSIALLMGNAVAETFPIQLNQVIADGTPGVGAGRIDVNTADDVYTFAGTNGQNIFLEDISAASSFAGWLRWELRTPSSSVVSSGYLDGSVDGRRTLPESGTYTLRVWVGAANPAYVGTYSFRVRTIPADPTFPIQFGAVITNGMPGIGAGNIEVPGAWDYYTFTGTTGQLAFFESLGAAGTFQGNLYCEVKTPSGASVFSSYLTPGNHPGRKLLTETGTYRIRVYSLVNHTNHTGTYSFRVRALHPDESFAIQPGDTVTNNIPAAGAGNIDAPGAQDFYTFNATAGQSVSFEVISKAAAFAGWLQWEARTPGGTLLFGNYFADAGRKTLPETGTYTIRVWVGANVTTYLGNYAFRINTLPGDVRINITKGDVIGPDAPVPGAGRIDEPGGLDTYTFAGLAGQRVHFEQLSADAAFSGWLYWQVIAPGGTNWFAGYFPGNLKERRTLPVTGNYTIRVFANGVNPSFVGPYSFRTWCEVSARPDQLATLPDTALAVPLNKFLCNDRLEIGDAGTIDITNAVTAQGGSLVATSGTLVYTPSPGFRGLDQFTYRLRGIFGGEDYATVPVRVGAGVREGATVVSQVREGAAGVMVCLLGEPNQTYRVEQSTYLTNWTNLGQLTADADGSMTYNYNIEPVQQRFYRFQKQ